MKNERQIKSENRSLATVIINTVDSDENNQWMLNLMGKHVMQNGILITASKYHPQNTHFKGKQ